MKRTLGVSARVLLVPRVGLAKLSGAFTRRACDVSTSSVTVCAVACLSALSVLPATAASASPAAEQRVDGELATLDEVSLFPNAITADLANRLAPTTNGAVSFAFDVEAGTVGGFFSLSNRPVPGKLGTGQGQDTYALVFLDKPMGAAGAKVLLRVDEHIQSVERGTVPTGARSVHVYATHGTGRTFRYVAARCDQTEQVERNNCYLNLGLQ